MVQIFENLDFGKIFRKIWILVKFPFWSKFWEISISVKNFDCGQNFRKISSLVKISNKFDFFENFETFRFWSLFSKIFGFSQIFEKNYSILVKIFEKFYFSQIFAEISILLNFRKILILVKSSKKFPFCSKFFGNFLFQSKLSILVKIFDKYRF